MKPTFRTVKSSVDATNGSADRQSDRAHQRREEERRRRVVAGDLACEQLVQRIRHRAEHHQGGRRMKQRRPGSHEDHDADEAADQRRPARTGWPLPENRRREQHREDRHEEVDRRAFGERNEAKTAEEENRRDDKAERAHELDAEMARAPEAVAASVPRDRRDDDRLAGVARPHDEEHRVIANEILRRRVERAQAKAREQEQRQRAA